MKLKLFFVLLLLGVVVQAQDFSFGKVSRAELEEKKHQLEPDAEAAVLYSERDTKIEYLSDGFQTVTQMHQRIKIYTKEGLDWATKQIYLYQNKGNAERVSKIKGITYNLVDGKIEKTKLKKEGIFKEEVSKFRLKQSITMPNVKVGSVIEWTYTVFSPYLSIDDVHLQLSIPINEIKAEIETPQYYTYKKRTKGYYPIKINSTRKNRTITINSKTRSGWLTTTTEFHSDKINYVANVDYVKASNIPSLKSESYVNNINNYRTTLLYELSSRQFPGAKVKYYSNTWEDVAKSIYRYSSFGEELKKTGYFKEDLAKINASISDPQQKLVAIYEFVKGKMNWDKYYGVGCNKGVRKAYKEGTGNVAEINLMLTAMLREAGLDANPVLVSTRSNGIPIFPTRNGYNYVISAVSFDQGLVLLDATEKAGTPNILPVRALNWNGRLIKKEGQNLEISLTPNKKAMSNYNLMVKIDDVGDLTGKYRATYKSHRAMSFRKSYSSSNEEEYIRELEKNQGDIEIENYKQTNFQNVYKPVMESYEFVWEEFMTGEGDKMYISPMLFFRTKENPFKLDERSYPIDFVYPEQKKYRILFQIPEGYQVESVPEPMYLKLPDNIGAYKYNLVAKGNSLQLNASFDINVPIIGSDYYGALKEMFAGIIKKEGEKVILSKK